MGYVQPPTREDRARRHRGHRLRQLPPDRGRCGSNRRAVGRLLPVLHLLAAHPGRGPRRGEPGRPGLLQPARRRAAGARDHADGHAASLGPAPGAAGQGRLGGPRHDGVVRRLRRPGGGGPRRSGKAVHHDQRTLGGREHGLPVGPARARHPGRSAGRGRHPPPPAGPRAGHRRRPGLGPVRHRPGGRHHAQHGAGLCGRPRQAGGPGTGRRRRRRDQRRVPGAADKRLLPGPAGPGLRARAATDPGRGLRRGPGADRLPGRELLRPAHCRGSGRWRVPPGGHPNGPGLRRLRPS